MKTGVLFLHGFTGGPYEVEPFVDYVKKETDWEVVVPTLTGHGAVLELEKKEARAERWISEAIVHYRRLSQRVDRVIVVGFSMGGLLAIYLAAHFPIDRLVLLSAAAQYVNVPQLAEDLWIKAQGKSISSLPQRLHRAYDYKLTHTPPRAVVQFLRIWSYVKQFYEKVSAPVCLVHGTKDAIVPIEASYELFERLGSKEKQLVIAEGSKHHVCYSERRERWFQEALQFMKKSD